MTGLIFDKNTASHPYARSGPVVGAELAGFAEAETREAEEALF
jgi:hypothetical protein